MDTDDARVHDRLLIRDLVDAYAHHADRREPEAQAAVFAHDGLVRLHEGDPARTLTPPLQTIEGREQLAAVFTDLVAQYETTTYLNGQSTVRFTGPDEAAGESYCLAMHLLQEDGRRVLLTMSIRYLDRFVRREGQWLIAERDLVFDWTDRRPSSP